MNELYVLKDLMENVGAGCSALSLVIESIEDQEDGSKTARGSIECFDHHERCRFSDPWEAAGWLIPGGIAWHVWRKNDGTGWKPNPETGECLFTCNSGVDAGIREFIARELDQFLTQCQPVETV